MESIKKLNDLITGQTYVVVGYSDPINSKYGVNYILLVVNKIQLNVLKYGLQIFSQIYFYYKPKGKIYICSERAKRHEISISGEL